MTTGFFVTFEGIDGCGKSTQLKLAVDELTRLGVHPVVTREPGGTSLAERIRAIVMDAGQEGVSDRAEVLLYLAARAGHVRDVIVPALEQGRIILCDRFEEATFAYQGAGRGIDLSELRRLNTFATNGIRPDRVFVFDLSPQTAAARIQASGKSLDRLEQSGIDFFTRVRGGYLAQAESDEKRITVLDAAGDPETIAGKLMAVLLRDLKQTRLID